MLLYHKETKLERADFQAGCSEFSWSGRAQSVLGLKPRGQQLTETGEKENPNISLSFFVVTNINS